MDRYDVQPRRTGQDRTGQGNSTHTLSHFTHKPMPMSGDMGACIGSSDKSKEEEDEFLREPPQSRHPDPDVFIIGSEQEDRENGSART